MAPGPEKPATYEWGKGREAYRIEGVSPQLESVYHDFATLPKGSVVLDVGAGEMRFAKNAPKDRKYAIYGLEVTDGGVDNFYARWERLKRGLQRLGRPSTWGQPKDHNVRADATELDYRDESGKQLLTAEGAVSWRVLHALSRENQLKVCKDIFDSLPPGGSFHVAVLSDKDWKLDALRKTGIQYDGKDLVDCEPAMQFPENKNKSRGDAGWRTDLEFFFSQKSLQELAEQHDAKFEIIGPIQEFAEASGLPHLLNHPENVSLEQENYTEGKYDRSKVKYYYAQFRKPA